MRRDAGIRRRELLAAAGAATLAGTLPLDAFARRRRRRRRRRPPPDWPQTARRLNARRYTPTPVEGSAERWRLRMAGGIPGAPAIVGSVVYAASFAGEVLAAELETGKELWRRTLPSAEYGDNITGGTRQMAFYAGPAVIRGRVLAASDRLFCLSAADGRTLWEAPPLRSDDSDDYFWGPPTVAGNLVLVGSGSGSELPRARGKLTAYDLRSGRLRWSTPTVPPGGNGGGVIGPPGVDLRRGLVYVATGSPYEAVEGPNPGTCALIELSLRTGKPRWTDQVHEHDERGLDFNSAPVLVGTRLFATNKDGVRAWDRLARTRLWHTQLTPEAAAPVLSAGPTDGPEGGPLASDGERVFALSNDAARGSFVAAALDPASGEPLWEQRLPGLATAAPAVAGPTVWFAAVSGVLHGLRASDGATAATVPLLEPSSGAPAAARGRLVVGTGAAPYFPGESLVCVG